MLTNKKILVLSVILLIAAAGIGFAFKNKPRSNQAETTPQNKKVAIGTSDTIFACFPYFVAEKKKLFEQNKLDVEFKQVQTSIAPQALLAGDIDYSPFVTGVIMASQNNLPIKIVMVLTEKSSTYLVGQPNMELKNIKTLGISQPFGIHHYQGLELISKNNLPAKITFMKGAVALRAQLAAGAIDAAIIGVSTVFQMENSGLKIMDALQGAHLIDGGLVTTEEKIKNDPEEIKKIISSLRSAINFIQDNPAETKDLIFEFYSLEKNEINKAIVDKIYLVFDQYFLEGGIPNKDSVIRSVQFAKTSDSEPFSEIEKKTVSSEEIAKSFNFDLLQ